MRTISALCVTVVLAMATVCSAAGAGATSRPAYASLVEGNNAFATELYAKLAEKPGNVFFSPASIHTCLAMTYVGSAGQTRQEMTKTLHYGEDKDFAANYSKLLGFNNAPTTWDGKEAYALVTANALWGKQGLKFKPAFTATLKDDFGSELHEVDFGQPAQAAKTINDWVLKQTKDKIKDLVPVSALNAGTMLVLTNAIYFKSQWQEPFEAKLTKDEPFKLSADQSIKTPMMHNAPHAGYMENDQLQLLDLPYMANDLSMIVLLPRKVDGLAELEKALTAENLAKWLQAAKNQTVSVTLPKFKFTGDYLLAETLAGMGMASAFDSEKADFSGILGSKLWIAHVIHKSFVAVDESGTEAAAATAVIMEAGAAPAKPKDFTADHPFIFMIRHNKTGEILFMGRLADPSM